MSASARPVRRYGPNAIATPANYVTIARLVVAVPTIFLIVEEGASWLTVSLWFVLCYSDRIDGWLARRDGTTRSGAFLDPIADKFLVLGGWAALAVRDELAWAALVIIAVREVGISLYRSWAVRRGISMPARQLGKYKAFFQFVAVGVVLLPISSDWYLFQEIVLWTAVALSVLSGIQIVAGGATDHFEEIVPLAGARDESSGVIDVEVSTADASVTELPSTTPNDTTHETGGSTTDAM